MARIRPAQHLQDLERMLDRINHRAKERAERGDPHRIELREVAALEWALPKLHAWAEEERLKQRPQPAGAAGDGPSLTEALNLHLSKCSDGTPTARTVEEAICGAMKAAQAPKGEGGS